MRLQRKDEALKRPSRAIVADIGGTNARFSLLGDAGIGPVEHTKVADDVTAADAIAAFLARHAALGSTDFAILDAGPAKTAAPLSPTARG